MKYELIKYDIGTESGTDEEGNYTVNITISIHPVDGIAPDFSKDIIVINNNSQTGYEVDKQREQEIIKFIETINN